MKKLLTVAFFTAVVFTLGQVPSANSLSAAEPKAGERKVVKIKGVDFAFRYCPAGSFNRAGQKVTLSGFYIGETEVTQEQWEGVMGKNPSNFKGDKLPVEQVSWNTCQE
ncbi:MAG: hypothetical protein LBH00_03660, partial [Planctomycetaceae bacterium]|nr:hypothetical protein [Planctomycetaceae bacterium]